MSSSNENPNPSSEEKDPVGANNNDEMKQLENNTVDDDAKETPEKEVSSSDASSEAKPKDVIEEAASEAASESVAKPSSSDEVNEEPADKVVAEKSPSKKKTPSKSKKSATKVRHTRKTAAAKAEHILVVGVIHAHWCGHCTQLMGPKHEQRLPYKPSIWKNAKKMILDKKPKKVEVVFVDIESEKLHTIETMINDKYNVKLSSKGYPTIFKIWGGKLDQEFNMERTDSNIADWALVGMDKITKTSKRTSRKKSASKNVEKVMTEEDGQVEVAAEMAPQMGGKSLRVPKKVSKKKRADKKSCGCKGNGRMHKITKSIRRWWSSK